LCSGSDERQKELHREVLMVRTAGEYYLYERGWLCSMHKHVGRRHGVGASYGVCVRRLHVKGLGDVLEGNIEMNLKEIR
jgi:hypothetical protein